MKIVREKVTQAEKVLRGLEIDCWLTLVRETKVLGDPIMPYIAGIGVVGLSAFILTSDGKKIAVLASFDTISFEAQGIYDEIIPYTKSFKEPFLEVLNRLDPKKIAVNYSPDDCTADGLTHGMYLKLCEMLEGTKFSSRLVSAERVINKIRGCKSPEEIARIKSASEKTLEIFDKFERSIRPGWTTSTIEKFFHDEVDSHGYGYSWEEDHDPSLTTGSLIPGHGTVPNVKVVPGTTIRIDFGIRVDGYSSDLQRSWYVLANGETCAPQEVQSVFDVVLRGIRESQKFLRPGVAGWEVDAVARNIVLEAGFEEFNHSLGHQLGALAHDGGGGLSPKWERYGNKPLEIIEKDQVYTLEFGLPTPRGWVSLEEMVVVTGSGCEYIVPPQEKLRLIGGDFSIV